MPKNGITLPCALSLSQPMIGIPIINTYSAIFMSFVMKFCQFEGLDYMLGTTLVQYTVNLNNTKTRTDKPKVEKVFIYLQRKNRKIKQCTCRFLPCLNWSA
jgi:hypothetical protein